MKRSLFVRVLFSLLLLLSQQMAISHAMSHWAGTAEKSAQVQVDSKPSKGGAQELGCSQCFAYSQMVSAIGTPSYAMLVVDVRLVHLALLTPSSDCVRTVCVFQSRAPPQT